MSERDKRVKAFEKLMRGGLSSTDVFCLKTQLMAMGFFTAPASTKYHGNYEGGLFDHSFTVTSSLLSLTKRMGLNWKRKASPYIVGMLHDPVSYTHLRAHETKANLVCRLLLEKKKNKSLDSSHDS